MEFAWLEFLWAIISEVKSLMNSTRQNLVEGLLISIWLSLRPSMSIKCVIQVHKLKHESSVTMLIQFKGSKTWTVKKNSQISGSFGQQFCQISFSVDTTLDEGRRKTIYSQCVGFLHRRVDIWIFVLIMTIKMEVNFSCWIK